MWPKNMFDIDVSRETEEKLQIYHDLLVKWQKAINLVSPKTIPEAWVRHFADSVQVQPLLRENVNSLYDLGSGAGFPGLVIAILNPEIKVSMIESDERKGQFMKTVARETECKNVTIITQRIENTELPPPDMITARALADMTLLLDWCEPWARQKNDMQMIFLKGSNWRDEVDAARRKYDFDCEDVASQTDPSARILKISNLSACA